MDYVCVQCTKSIIDNRVIICANAYTGIMSGLYLIINTSGTNNQAAKTPNAPYC